jgi:hypothetical protein
LNRKFLEDYQAKETERYDDFSKDLINGKIDSDSVFPEASRFKKPLLKPVIKAELTSLALDNEPIWSQIPFAGTLIIPLYNINKENFLSKHSFGIEDIQNLITLSKDFGKIQFTLAQNAEFYRDLDFLDPIFTELEPPQTFMLPIFRMVDPKILESWRTAFNTLAKIHYDPWLLRVSDEQNHSDDFLTHFRFNRVNIFSMIKFLQLDELATEIENCLIDDPEKANFLLGQFLTLNEGLFDSLRCGKNQSISRLGYYGIEKKVSSKKPEFPCELGSLIMKELTPTPSSYEACVSVIDTYKQNDLYNVLLSFDKGVKDRNLEQTISTKSELETIFRNIWLDADRLRNAQATINHGLSVCLGLVGEFGLSLMQQEHIPPLLAGLGTIAVGEVIKFDKISKFIVDKINKDYMVNIYDFKQKIPIR